MKNFFALLASLVLSTSSLASAKTIIQCAVGRVSGGEGARINLLQADDGSLKANLIFGTTVSGTVYHVLQTSPGVYQGQINAKPEFSIHLIVSPQISSNKYINGHKSSLQIIYPDLNSQTGKSSFKSSPTEDFVCGKKIGDFGS